MKRLSSRSGGSLGGLSDEGGGPPPRSTRMLGKPSISLSLLLALLAMVVCGSTAFADKVDDLIGQLKDSDNKVRLSAALNLGKIGDKRAIPPLIETLKDSNNTVRGVAAAALGKLVDASVPAATRDAAIDALKDMAANDTGLAQTQAAKAYAAVKDLHSTPGGGGNATSSGGTGVNGKMIYVEIGPFADKTTSPDPKMLPFARGKVEAGLAKQFATQWPGGKSPTQADITKAGVKAYYVDGTLSTLTVAVSGSNATITCRASMLLATYPSKSVFAVVDPSHSKTELDTGSSAKEIAEGKQLCFEALLGDIVQKQLVPAIKMH